MAIKDEIVSWFIRNVAIPKLEIIDHPGFITMKPMPSKQVYSRQILMSESFLVNLENKIVEKYGNEGRRALYSIGKRFGYRFSIMIDLPTIQRCNKKEFLTLAYFIGRFIESTYAHKVLYKINFDLNEFDLTFDGYVVCRKNGKGYIMTDGGSAGIWAYALQDLSVEGVQVKCQGRGDKKCEVICAPPKILEKKGLTFFKETNLEDLEIEYDRYEEMNKIRETQYAKNSFEDLINIGFFDYSRGVVKHKDERYFLCEASLPYIIEMELKKLEGATKILFDCAFDHGKKIAKLQGECNFQEFMMQFLSACGYGDILVLELGGGYKVTNFYFPWTKFADEVKFEMYRGLVSGLISGCLNKEIIFNKLEIDTLGKGLTLILSL
ncbi:MAG: hypothetical protein QXY62_04475 [Candidatus Altiarchaeota archaeon]